MIRAVTYARFSTDKQTEASIDDQRRCCNEYAKKNGMKVVREYQDLAISGASFGNRPGVNALQKSAFAGELDVILVADLTRLSRNSADLPKFLERMRFRKIRVVGVLDQFDSELRHSRMQAGLSGIMSDEYRAAVGERVHLALDTLAKTGKPTGGRCYGYTSTLEKVPEQVKRVREIFKRIAAGESMKSICVDFNKRGIPSPGANWKRTSNRSDGRWMVPAINALVQNDVYSGRLVWNRSQWVKDPESGKRKRRERPAHEWVVQERPDLAIVDKSTFNEVAAMMTRRKQAVGARGGGRAKYVLSGLLECALCGSRFILSGGGRNSRGYGTPGAKYYVCSTYHQGGLNACRNSLRVDRQTAEQRLLAPALDELLSPESVDKAVIKIKKLLREHPPVAVADVSAIEAKVAKVKALVAAGALDSDLAEPLYAKLEAERLALVKVAKAKAKAPLMSGAWGIEAEYRAQAAKWRTELKGEDADVARAALTAIYGPRILLHPDFRKGELAAQVSDHPDALLAQVGGLGRISLSSGGPQSGHIPLIRKGKK
jgi:site-specific DNA recombinase